MSKLWRVIGDNATEQVLLETSAENVTVADTGGKLKATTVEGALSELADGVNELRKTNIIDVGQGTPTTENGYTITPVNFTFSNGTSKTVNIYAEQGEKGDTVATGAKLSGTIATTDWESTAVEPYFLNSNIVEWGSISVGGSDISNAKMSENNLGIELGKTYTFNVSLNGVAYDVTGTPQDVGIIMLPIGIGGTEENPTYQVVFCDQMDLSTGALGTGSAVYGAVFDESVEVTSVVINSVDPAIGGETKALYTLSNSAIKANSTVSMYLNSADEVRAYSKTDGSVVVEIDAVPTVAIPYTLQVVETSTEGAFEIINSYVPVIPTDNSELTNGAGYITNTPEHLYLTDTSTGKLYEVTIANGTISLVAQSST